MTSLVVFACAWKGSAYVCARKRINVKYDFGMMPLGEWALN